ncbi:bromodomain adjacent to zinc finger domain protein 1A [Uranotaenia lowii]|uniref:bromodomain adjacent to zinc finger domain protein 1A n=1 Tax=Uranotaenia lowii TaxID=190385 RepID=UPI002478ABD6|nr:bromodomain adjacent to zinc finger domain protein 1A [Uranotaenia lowii]
MPLLRKQVFEKVADPERLRDSDEVFFCETTNEIFSNYDDYFHRVMLISSMVWSCAVTGKPNLTYAEALDSEKQARRQLKTFPSALKGPFLLVATHTKRSSFNELVEDVCGYIKERYFKGEEVDVVDPSGKTREATILEVIAPSNKTNSPVKTEKLRYRVAATDARKPKEWNASADNVKRARSAAPREKCKLFLKMHVEQSGAVLRIKEPSLKKFVSDEGITDEQIFFGKPPDFEKSKRLMLAEAKKLREDQEKKNTPPKKEKSITKKGPKSNGSAQKDGKQQSISKYLNKSDDESAKTAEIEKKKLAEEMERLRKEKAEKDALKKKHLEEQKAMLSQQVTVAIKKFKKVQEDLELSDQRVLPTPTTVSTIVDEKHISDFIFVLEFMTSFAELLSIKDKFAHGLTIDLLERALVLREVNGPLSDIFQVLLSTLFSHQIEEENEIAVKFDLNSDSGIRKNNLPILKKATKAAIWCETHYNTKLNELPMDSTTISELLRLHFLSSGALIEDKGAKWRFGMRGGYNSFDDPGIQLVNDHPHIFRALVSNTVFQLPVGDILRILKCLIDQLMTYSSVRELIEERLEKARVAKLQFISANVAKSKREAKLVSEKTAMKNDIKKQVVALEGSADEKNALKKELEDKMAEDVIKLEAELEKDVKIIVKEIDKFKENFFDYQIYLGSDRAHRNYWLFESLPGLFVEHDYAFCGKCLEKPTPQIPGLALCPEDQRKKFITQAIMNNIFSDNDKENDGIKPDIAIEKLILAGSAKLKGLFENKRPANGTSEESSSTSEPKEIVNPSLEELLMCTANPKSCPVHTNQYVHTKRWTFYNTVEQIEALIDSLNVRGIREKALRDNLQKEKELILNHLENCPVEKLTVDPKERESLLASIVNKSRKYDSPNFNHEPGTDPNVIFETSIRENILELESKITVGYLGTMKVSDRDEWREAIEQFEYKQLSEPLLWGSNRVMPFKENKEELEEQDEGMENDEPDETDMEKLLSNSVDPGYDLPDSLIIESEEKTDNTESETVKEKVRSLAKALLQIEQCIDSKFLRHPFGPNKVIKDKGNAAKALYRGQRNLARWEESLMRSTNYAQLFLHYNVLYDSIHWSSSAERRPCMICRRKGDPDMTLLCDECNRACHMYCLKPKLKQVPEGDWFCPKCKPENYATKKQKRRKIFEATEEEIVEDEVVKEEQKATAGSDDDSANSDEEDGVVCQKCKVGGATAMCTTCNKGYHTQCTKTLTDTPKKRWECDKCCQKVVYNETRKKKKNKKSKKNKVAVRLAASRAADDSFEKLEDEPEEEENMDESEEVHNDEVEEPVVKKRSSKRSILTELDNSDNDSDNEALSSKVKRNRRSNTSSSKRSLSNGFHENGVEERPAKVRRSTMNNSINDDLDSSSSRRVRRTGEDLPLNNVILYTLLEDILKHPESWPFDRPVSVKEVPDYYDIIKNPMDFAKIKSKLNMGEYTINEQMMNDVQLVFRNCDLYNTDETEIYVAGRNLERFVLQRSRELSLPFKPSDMLKNDHLLKNGTNSPKTATAKLNGGKDNQDVRGSGKRRSMKK